MTKARRYRWECPICGKARLGSSRPVRLATVRYCLPCSETRAELVQTTSPVLAARSCAKAAKAKTRRERKKEKASAKWYRAGLDVRKEVKRCCKVTRIPAPALSIRASRVGTSGRSYGGRVVLSIPLGATRAETLALVAHEIAHESVWDQHGPLWRKTFLEIVHSAYGVDAGDPGGSSHNLHTHIELALA